MKFNKKKIAAVALSSLFVCGALSGCDLITSNAEKDLLQVVAEVDISNGETFQSGGEYAAYADVINTESILKRDLVVSFYSVGYQYVENYGYSYEDTYELLLDSLVNRQIYLQYSKVYFFEGDNDYTVSGYQSAVSGKYDDDLDLQIAQIAYFLTDEEKAVAEYSVKTSLNSTLDTLETTIIAEENDTTYDTARTTPTGVDTETEDFYDEAYKVYIGYNSASNCGSYETVNGSTPTTRRKAYEQFLSSLDANNLISKGEDSTNLESLSYYRLELKSAYESKIISKLADEIEKEAEGKITREWIEDRFEQTLKSQQESFDDSASSFESALDSVSDSSFVLYSPDSGYGFVFNILLPFNTSQSTVLENASADYGDKQGNVFVQRAQLLEKVVATDQRKTWFTCEEDYSFTATEDDAIFTNGDTSRSYLFFENNLKKTNQYEAIPNYLGAYSYNGKAEKDDDGDYVITPAELSVDGVLSEMKGYLNYAGYTLVSEQNNSVGYFNKTYDMYYDADGNVDYDSFVYYYGKVAKDGTAISDTFNANNVFVSGSTENKAMSVINELSFAYNTDTAGLNSYLGYVVSPEETNFVKEFEYAAQLAVRGGAGTIVVTCSDYGWHIIYCTFSFANTTPYTFHWDEIEVEGTFSNLYYEAIKASNFDEYSSDRQTQLINLYYNDECVTTYEKRYADLIAAGNE